MLPLLFVLLTPPPSVEVEAARVEIGPDGWRADALTLDTPDGRLTATAAEGAPTAACPDGALRLTGPLTLTAPRGRLDAAAATLCLPDGRLTATDARLAAPRLAGGAARADWRDGHLVADDPWFTACGCADPPWQVEASRAWLTPGEGAWATWPVLRAGGVPVLAAPVAYVPLARRRTGLLLPTLGYDADDGLWGRLPVFVTLGPSLDLTVAPGWRDGVTVDGRVRWAASDVDVGEIDGGWVPLDGGFGAGHGTTPLGPARLAVAGGWADTPDRWRARRPGYIDRTRATLAADIGLAAVGSSAGLGVRGGAISALDDEAFGRSRVITAPEVWTRLGGAVGPVALALDGQIARYADRRSQIEVYDVGVEARSIHWLGPLRIEPLLVGRTRIEPAGEDEDGGVTTEAAQQVSGVAALAAELAAARRYALGLHRVALTVDARAAGYEGGGGAALDPYDRPLESLGGGATLSTRWLGRRWTAEAALRVDYERLWPHDGWTDPWLRARVDGPWLGADVDVAAADALLASLRLGPAAGPRLDARYLRFEADPTLPWLTPRGPVLPLYRETVVDATHGATLGATVPVGPLTLSWQGALDVGRGRLVGQMGSAHLTGRCDCWAAGLWVGHEAGRGAPDVMLSLTLGGADARVGPALGLDPLAAHIAPASGSTP